MNTTRARLVTVCLSLLLLGASLGFAAPPHKVLAAPGQLDANAPGVVLWHDYGSFALYKVSDAALDALPAALSQLRKERVAYWLLDLPPAADDNRRVLAVLAWIDEAR